MSRLLSLSLLAACGTSNPASEGADPVEVLALELAEPRAQAVGSTLAAVRVTRFGEGLTHARLQQVYGGVPVFGGQVIVHLDQDGQEVDVTDRMLADLHVDTTPNLAGADGVERAEAVSPGRLHQAPELFVLRRAGHDHLTWRVQLFDELDSAWMVFVDAHSGTVVNSFDNLKTATGGSNYDGWVTIADVRGVGTRFLEDPDRQHGVVDFSMSSWYTDRDGVWDTMGHADAVQVQFGLQQTWDYFFQTHAWRGMDGADGPGHPWFPSNVTGDDITIGYTHYTTVGGDPNRAVYWNGAVYHGHGDGLNFGPVTSVDIVGHEFAHGVTEAEVGLVYQDESGAIDESYADIFGAMAESFTDGMVHAPTWQVGEDALTPGLRGDAIRFMDDPTADGVSRDCYQQRYVGLADNGGVHWNSGIANLAFVLLSQGGEHPSFPGNRVRGIGTDTASDIWLHGLQRLTPDATFADLREALILTARDRYGLGTMDVAVSRAFSMVGVLDPGVLARYCLMPLTLCGDPDPIPPRCFKP
jgi:Zn-dependent metalloprotease